LFPALKKLLTPRLNLLPDSGIVEPFPEGCEIPCIIHQTFPTKSLPWELQQNADKLRALNQGWEYRLYDDEDVLEFIKNNYDPNVLNYFQRINPAYGAAKADLFRYLLMYKCGGVYLDIKSSARKPFDNVFKYGDRYLLSVWNKYDDGLFEGWGQHPELRHIEYGEFQQWFIACSPGHPFLKAVINTVLRNINLYNPIFHGVGKDGVLRLTGPISYTLAIESLLKKYKYRLVDSYSELGLEYSIYFEKSHKFIFDQHYSTLKDSIINLNSSKKISFFLYRVLKRVFSFPNE